MYKPLLHPQTKRLVSQFTDQPSSALLLVGPNGVGKTFLAQSIAENLLAPDVKSLSNYPYFLVVRPDKNTVSIDAIRDLHHNLRLKTIGKQPIRRVVVVEHADSMTIKAQNAFLKMLEEPPSDTVIIMTASNQHSLLPTVLSRIQSIAVYEPSEVDCKQFFINSGKSASEVERSYFLSGGLPGLMAALLTSDNNHPLAIGIDAAKDILTKQVFQRLSMVDEMSKHKEESQYTLEALQRIARVGITQASNKADVSRLKQWHHILKLTAQARNALDQNANSKLTLNNFMLNL